MRKKRAFYTTVVALIAWMILIFSFSAQPAKQSADLSGGVGRKVASIFVPGFREWEKNTQEQFVDTIDFYIRKTAHFTEYMVLGALWILCLWTNPKGKYSLKKNMGISTFASVMYAMSDELHQLFVAGRAGRWMDVGIDALGAVTGVCLIGLGIFLFIEKRVWYNKQNLG